VMVRYSTLPGTSFIIDSTLTCPGTSFITG
jgi:hypothetical protein